MLVNLKDRLNDEKIVELLSYTVFPDPDTLQRTLKQFKENNALHIYGYKLRDEDKIIGLVGFRRNDEEAMEITHISVHPEYRGLGYGRGQILELIDLQKPKQIFAETDEEAVDFYRNIGFSVMSLGEKYPGVERFYCEFKV